MDRPTRPQTSKPRGVCKYFSSPGGCNNGNNCRFIHGEGEALSAFDKSKVCRFYLNGFCKRGSNCWFRHENDSIANSSDTSASVFTPLETYSSEDDICCVCQEKPVTYGLLAECSHVCCLECLRDWRDPSGKSRDIIDSGNTKKCPYCRTPSPFITPSSIFFPNGHPRKATIIEQYKASMARKPCKYFQLSSPRRRYCPFGRDCFYQHQESDGTPFIFPHGADYYLSRTREQENATPNFLGSFLPPFTNNPGPTDMLRTLSEIRERLASLSLLPSTAGPSESDENYLTRLVDDVLTSLEDALTSTAEEEEERQPSNSRARNTEIVTASYTPLPLTRSFMASVDARNAIYTQDEIPPLLDVSDDSDGDDLPPLEAIPPDSPIVDVPSSHTPNDRSPATLYEPEGSRLFITADSETSEFSSGMTSLTSSLTLSSLTAPPLSDGPNLPQVSHHGPLNAMTDPHTSIQNVSSLPLSSHPQTPLSPAIPLLNPLDASQAEPLENSRDDANSEESSKARLETTSSSSPRKECRRSKNRVISPALRTNQSFVTDGRGRVVATDDGTVVPLAAQYWHFETTEPEYQGSSSADDNAPTS